MLIKLEQLEKENHLLRRMYAVALGGGDDALSLLEAGRIWDAKAALRQTLEKAEELYVSGVERGELREQKVED